MENKELEEGKEIGIKQFWEIFLKNWWILLLALFVFCTGFLGIWKWKHVNQYTAQATLWVMRETSNNTVSSTADVSISLASVHDYAKLIQSNRLYNMTYEYLQGKGYNIPPSLIGSWLSVETEDSSRIIYLSITCPYPEIAKETVNAIANVSTVLINEKVENSTQMIQVFDEEEHIPTQVSNPFPTFKFLVVAAAGVFFTYLVCLCVDLLNNKITNEDDVKRYLQLTVLGDISNFDSCERREQSYLQSRKNNKERY